MESYFETIETYTCSQMSYRKMHLKEWANQKK